MQIAMTISGLHRPRRPLKRILTSSASQLAIKMDRKGFHPLALSFEIPRMISYTVAVPDDGSAPPNTQASR
jgi:hypothetical protein